MACKQRWCDCVWRRQHSFQGVVFFWQCGGGSELCKDLSGLRPLLAECCVAFAESVDLKGLISEQILRKHVFWGNLLLVLPLK